jgi:hypothetical protein
MSDRVRVDESEARVMRGEAGIGTTASAGTPRCLLPGAEPSLFRGSDMPKFAQPVAGHGFDCVVQPGSDAGASELVAAAGDASHHGAGRQRAAVLGDQTAGDLTDGIFRAVLSDASAHGNSCRRLCCVRPRTSTSRRRSGP